MTRYILTFCIIINCFSCRKEENKKDFYCKINDEVFTVNNSLAGNTKVRAKMLDSTSFNLWVNAGEDYKGIIGTFRMDITNIHGAGNYSKTEFTASVTRYVSDNNGGYYGFPYYIDTSKTVNLYLSTFREPDRNIDGQIIGDFNFTLIYMGNSTNFSGPKTLTVTNGHFERSVNTE